MIWENSMDESLGDWRTPWRVWSGGRSHVMYPEFSRLKHEWERTQRQLGDKYRNRENMTDDEWTAYKRIRNVRF